MSKTFTDEEIRNAVKNYDGGCVGQKKNFLESLGIAWSDGETRRGFGWFYGRGNDFEQLMEDTTQHFSGYEEYSFKRVDSENDAEAKMREVSYFDVTGPFPTNDQYTFVGTTGYSTFKVIVPPPPVAS